MPPELRMEPLCPERAGLPGLLAWPTSSVSPAPKQDFVETENS